MKKKVKWKLETINLDKQRIVKIHYTHVKHDILYASALTESSTKNLKLISCK